MDLGEQRLANARSGQRADPQNATVVPVIQTLVEVGNACTNALYERAQRLVFLAPLRDIRRVGRERTMVDSRRFAGRSLRTPNIIDLGIC
jgi:hypothetical protein